MRLCHFQMLQIGILYVLSVCILCKNFSLLRTSLYFYTMLFGIFFLLVVPLLYVLLDKNPITWILFYISGEPRRVSFYFIYASTISITYEWVRQSTFRIRILNLRVLFSGYVDNVLDHLLIVLRIRRNISNAVRRSSYDLRQEILSCPSSSGLYSRSIVRAYVIVSWKRRYNGDISTFWGT